VSDVLKKESSLPEQVVAIKRRGYVVWKREQLDPEFRARFDSEQIPVVGIRHVRVWGIQVDDERELPGHERTSIPDEELWEIQLRAKDGSTYEVNSALVAPAPE
jgi:hypothetical protein